MYAMIVEAGRGKKKNKTPYFKKNLFLDGFISHPDHHHYLGNTAS
jgi:hypothetical protein